MTANIIIGFVAFLHFYFMYLEMFVWTTPRGLKIFAQTQAQADSSKTLAFNQGLYNGFLAAGLLWSLLEPDPFHAQRVGLFFLSCVIVAGIVGGYTVNKKIFFIQALPAAIALAALLI